MEGENMMKKVSGVRYQVLLFALPLLYAPIAFAQGVFERDNCATIASPVTNKTWCFDRSDGGRLKRWNGSAYVTVDGGPHAATHEHGGTDNLGTSVPAANAIPKADGTGKLAAGWIPGHATTHQHGGSDEIA